MLCVFTDEQLRQVCLAAGLADAIPAGSTLVAVVRQIAAELGDDLGILDRVIEAGLTGAK